MMVKIYITLKEGVLDPQGKAVKEALDTMGYRDVANLRIGKFMEMQISTDSKTEAAGMVKEMCEKFLANTVIEDYRFEID